MSLLFTILWTIGISLLGVAAAWYARRFQRADALIALYVVLVVFSNIVASKTIAFDFGITSFFAPGAVLLFSVTFLLTDIVNERFGKKETQRMILIALFAQAAVILFSQLIIRANGAPFFENQQAFEILLGNVPRLVLASLIAFFLSENLDALLFHGFRRLTQGKHLWMRNALSSLPAMIVDSAIFVTIAFYGVMPVLPLILGLVVTKWLVGVVDIPFMYLSRWILGSHRKGHNIEAPVPHSGI